MILKKSKDALIKGTVSLVKASMSLRSPGTAADNSFWGRRAKRISASSNG